MKEPPDFSFSAVVDVCAAPTCQRDAERERFFFSPRSAGGHYARQPGGVCASCPPDAKRARFFPVPGAPGQARSDAESGRSSDLSARCQVWAFFS